MPSTRPFRFGVIAESAPDGFAWINKARRAESLGYDTFLVPDHLSLSEQLAPMPALAAIVTATSKLRLGAFVFDNDFRHPVLLAKEIATLDLLSNGRVEWAIGAGWFQSEYQEAGIPFESAGLRVSRMEEAITIMKALFASSIPVNFSGRYYTITDCPGYPLPVQHPHPPLVIGGGGSRVLNIAAREADIIG